MTATDNGVVNRIEFLTSNATEAPNTLFPRKRLHGSQFILTSPAGASNMRSTVWAWRDLESKQRLHKLLGHFWWEEQAHRLIQDSQFLYGEYLCWNSLSMVCK